MGDYASVVAGLGGTVLGAVATYFGQHLQQTRTERRHFIEQRRIAYAKFLGCSHDLFDDTRSCYRDLRWATVDRDAMRARLQEVRASPCRESLDMMRLLATPLTVEAANALWRHLRRKDVVGGGLTDGAAVAQWSAQYWDTRLALIQKFREELGLLGNVIPENPAESPGLPPLAT